jgi:spore germination protein KB
MSLEKGQISHFQLLLAVGGFIIGAVVSPDYAVVITKQNTWIVTVSGFMVGLLFIWFYVKIALYFPGQNMVQLWQTIFGTWPGRAISFYYLFYFLLIVFANLREVINAINTYFLPETPMLAVLVPLILILAQAVSKGIEVIVRMLFLTLSLFLLVFIGVFILLIPQLDFTNLQPLFDFSLLDFLQGTHIVSAILFGEVLLFLMILPYTKEVTKTTKPVFAGTFIGFLFLILTAVRNQAVLGNLSQYVVFSTFEVVRLIDIAEVFTRMELLIVISFITLMFFRICLVYYASSLGLAQLFNLRSYRSIILPLGIVIAFYTVIIYDYNFDLGFVGTYIWPQVTVPFQILIPIAAYITIKIRKLPQGQGGKKK